MKGYLDESYKVLVEGLYKCKRKFLLLTELGETEFKRKKLDSAVYAWAQAIHCMGSNPVDYNPYLLLSYVAKGLKLEDISNSFLNFIDRIWAGGIRLDSHEATQLISLAEEQSSDAIKNVLVKLREKYLL